MLGWTVKGIVDCRLSTKFKYPFGQRVPGRRAGDFEANGTLAVDFLHEHCNSWPL